MICSNIAKKYHKLFHSGRFLLFLLAAGIIGCQNSSDEANTGSSPPVVEVKAIDYAFQAPDSIPSGWTTFRMINEGSEHHHFHLYRLPEGKTGKDFRDAAVEPVDSVFSLLQKGVIDSSEARRAIAKGTSAWARRSRLAKRGGVGAVAPGRTGQVTVELEPGQYVMNCLIPTPEGAPHFTLGMVRGITVTDVSTRATAPSYDTTLRASGKSLGLEGDLKAGMNTIRFVIDEVPGEVRDSTYTAWLTRLDTDTDLDAIAQAIQQEGKMPPAAHFVGGFEYLPVNRTAYFTVDLSSGRYGLVWGYRGNTPNTKEFIVE